MREAEAKVGNYRWIAQAWAEFAEALQKAGDNEAQIKQICEAEIASWRARETMQKENSLKTPMTKMRNLLKNFPYTERNSWLNPKTGEREHLARKYLNFSTEEWARINVPSEQSSEERSAHQLFLEDPDRIAAVAAQLLESKRWDEIVVGLAAATGRRLTEVLKTGEFFPSTRYTVMFAGQLKRRDKILAPYEIPTLVDASLVLQAWERLRTLVDCSQLSVEQVSHDYSPKVRATANSWFQDLIPTPKKHKDVYTHLCRSVYGCIAVFWFCPPRLSHITYLATIMGHYWVLDAETEKVKRDRVASLRYDDYKIGDEAIYRAKGRRQGVKLEEPGVSVLKAFQSAPAEPVLAEGELPVSNDHALTLTDAKKHSIIRVSQHTRQLFDAVAKELKTGGLDDTLQELLVRSNFYNQLAAALEPLGKQLGTTHPIDTVVAIQKQGLAGAKKRGRKKSPEAQELQELEGILHRLRQSGTENPVAYIKSLLEKDANFRAGLAKRQVRVDVKSLSLAQLRDIKLEEAANERFRRAVDAIMQHNVAFAAEPLKQWYINAGSVRTLVGGRHPAVKAYLASREEEIARHHQQYGITEIYNRKPPAMSIKKMIKLEGQDDGPMEKAEEEA